MILRQNPPRPAAPGLARSASTTEGARGQADDAVIHQRPLTPSPTPASAFTMIEMIGVLAVLAILATIIIASTPRQLDIVAGNLENTNLVNYATALQSSILRNRYIPGTSDITNVIATELGMDVKDVAVNGRYNTRAFLFYPANSTFFAFYTNRDLLDPSHLVHGGQGWQQNAGGAFNFPNGAGVYGGGSNLPPSKARVMIVSSLAGRLPGALAGLTEGDFNNLWDATTDASLQSVTGFGGWKYDDVRVQHIDLAPLFVHLILYNYNAPSTTQGQYRVDPDRLGTALTPVPAWNDTNGGKYGVDTYFLRGTVLGLAKSTQAGSALDSNQILSRDTSFAYVQDVWRSSVNLGEGVDPNAALFGNALWAVAQAFMSSPYNSLAVTNFGQKVSPPVVVTNMQVFMSNYVVWAWSNFPSGLQFTNVQRAQDVMISNLVGLAGSSVWSPAKSSWPNNSLNFSNNLCY